MAPETPNAPPEKQTGENVCPDCGGGGRLSNGPCPTCDGTGRVIEPVGDA